MPRRHRSLRVGHVIGATAGGVNDVRLEQLRQDEVEPVHCDLALLEIAVNPVPVDPGSVTQDPRPHEPAVFLVGVAGVHLLKT